MAKRITLLCNGKKLEINPLAKGMIRETSPVTTEIQAPGQGSFEISDPLLSAESICTGETVSCEVTVRGKNIYQICSELMIKVDEHLIGPVQIDFLPSPEHRETKGVIHPRWGQDNEINFEVKPVMRLLYCGEGFTLACMTPEQYGVEPEAQIWMIEGIYQRGGGEPFRARFDFDCHGALVRKTGFYPESVIGVMSPFELLVEDGDTFEPFVTMINEQGDSEIATVNPIMLGGGNLLHWEQIDACLGTFHLGVAVTDFDGQSTRRYSILKIKQP